MIDDNTTWHVKAIVEVERMKDIRQEFREYSIKVLALPKVR